MAPGERAALTGLLASMRPRLAIEIGTGQGGSLRCISAYSGHTHAFDARPPDPGLDELTNVTFHTGNSHLLLPEALAQFAQRGESVDFALVDGDHSAGGGLTCTEPVGTARYRNLGTAAASGDDESLQ